MGGSVNLAPLPIQKFFSNAGLPLVGGKLFTYAAGTDTKIATYQESGGVTSNTNPIRLDFRGECRVWIDPALAYKFVLSGPFDTDPPTNPIWTVDNITASPAPFDNAAVDTGTVNNISLTLPQISSPVAFTRVVFIAAHTNTGPTTLQINGGSASPVGWQSNIRLSGQEIRAGGVYQVIFNGATWQLQGPTLSPCDVRLFGAVPDGVTDCSAALAAATVASAAGKGNVVIMGGVYRITAPTTLVAGAVLSFGTGGQILANAGLTVNSVIEAPFSQQIFDGSSAITLSKTANPLVYANWFPGVDIGAKINKAAASVGKVGPLTIAIQGGPHQYLTPIDLIDSESIRLTGAPSAPIGTPNHPNPELIWTPNGSVTAVDFGGAFGFEIDHLTLTYSEPTYSGIILSLGIGSLLEARLGRVHDCSIQGTDTARLAARLIRLEGTLSTQIERCYFRYAVRGISCTGTSNNAIAIRDCWFEKEITAAMIQARGGAWDICVCVFEGDPAVGVVPALELVGELNGLSFKNNICVDGLVGTGVLIDLSGAVCTTSIIEENILGGGATAIKLRSTGGESSCIKVENTYIIATTGVDLAGSTDCTVKNNRLQCTNAWIGSACTRYQVENNRMDGITAAGQQVPSAGVIPVTLDAASGLGMVFVQDYEDSAQAIFFLAGPGAASAEVADPNGLYSNTAGTASSINVYWSAGNSRYELQNNRGGARSIAVNFLSGR